MHEYLFYVLKKGVTFSLKKGDEFAIYNIPNRQILLNPSVIPQSNSAPTMVKDMVILALRHELTHAYDFSAKDASSYIMSSLEKRIGEFKSKANLLLDALTCIDRLDQVNHNGLDRTALVMSHWNSSIYSTVFGTAHIGQAQSVQNQIDIFGSYFDSGKKEGNYQRHIIEIARVGKSSTYFQTSTWDVTRLQELFRSAKSTRVLNDVTDLEEMFLSNLPKAKLWENLSPNQKQALDLLYTLRKRLLTNIAQDEICFPDLTNCLMTVRHNCYNYFLECQAKNNADNYLVSIFETHAVLRERMDFHLLPTHILKNLCPIPVNMVENTGSTKKWVFKNAATKESHIDNNGFSSEDLFSEGLNSLGYSFVESMTESYLEAKNYQDVIAWKTFSNIAYLLCMYAMSSFLTSNKEEKDNSAWPLLLSITLVLLRNGIELANKNNDPSKITTLIKHSFNATLFATKAISGGVNPLLGSLTSGIVGSTVGSLCAKSMAGRLGWINIHNVLVEQIQKVIYGEQIIKYETFIKATNEKQYSKALRIASNSRDLKALQLIQLLIHHRKKLCINVSEQAGDENRSALHYAALKNNKAIYDFLLENGAHDMPDNRGKTAVDYLQAHAKPVSGFDHIGL